MLKIIFTVCMLLFFTLQAEVEEVLFTWDAALCQEQCIPLMERQLSSIRGVGSYVINPRAGRARIIWKPNDQFSFGFINLATRSVGIRQIETRVIVRGTITSIGGDFYIVSLGDRTRFRLMGPLRTRPGDYTIQANVANYAMSPMTIAKLHDAERKNLIVRVHGPLFEPERFYLAIIITKIEYPQELAPRPPRLIDSLE